MAELIATLEDVARGERGRIVAALFRLCQDLDAAEDGFQEALLAAMKAWRQQVPDNPGAWLMRAAKNSLWDALRRQRVAAEKAPLPGDEAVDYPDTIDTVTDDCLRLIFTCCHPVLSRDNQVALTLKVVAGFSTEDIGRAFVCSEDTISQRILRAKRALKNHQVSYFSPSLDDLGPRIAAVLGVVYAMFNEGHTARQGPLMRLDLQAEALRLGRLSCDLLPRTPEAFGLVAMMAFSAARAHTRVDEEGLPIMLADQDRSRWNKELLREGLMALQYARALPGQGAYVLQAELAALHVTAPAWEQTNWPSIIALYDALGAVAPSPIVALNRAIAVSMHYGAAEGLAALQAIEKPLAHHHLFYATRADFLHRLGMDPHPDYARSLALVSNDDERRFLQRKLDPNR